MIVPMKKVSVVTLKTLQNETLDALRDIGVLHIFTDTAESDRAERLREEHGAIERALVAIPPIQGESPEQSETRGGEAVDKALQFAERTQELIDERAQLEDEIERIDRELERFAPWGGVDPARLAELRDAGVDVGLYEVTPDRSDELVQRLPHAVTVSRGKSVHRIVGIATAAEELPASPEPISIPDRSTDELRTRRSEVGTRINAIDRALSDFGSARPMLLEAKRELESDFEFVYVQSTMDSEKELTWVTGFLPFDRVDEVKQAGKRNGWGVVIRDPDPDDQVPTQIRNPKAVRLVKPVFDLLGTVPGYREMDISFFFLLFFIVFFAMIYSDGGYGLILLTGTIIVAARGKRKGKRPGPGTTLMLVLSIATIVWGAITGNWFGYAPIADLPVLRDLVIPSISVDNEVSTEVIQYLCFVIGTAHLAIAHVWNFVRRIRRGPKIAAPTELGWLSMVLGLYYLVLQLVLDPAEYPMPDYALYMIIAGAAVVLIFGRQEPGQNFLVGVGKGLANIMPTALDGISAFSDIISYIRLFAVGLATLAIAEAFNGMATGVADSIGGVGGVAAAVAILLLGHTLNLAMGALSVVVHGVRLNMLEFSGHLGMEWTGVEYAPFRTR